jgi:plastocyanin
VTLILTRRTLMGIGCLVAAGARSGTAAEILEIVMHGTQDGSRVWFEPVGVHLKPGTIVRWSNRDPGNSHTTTAYHPTNGGHPLRIPDAAKPWDSDYLLPGERFEVPFTVEGVYDYFCQPHEMAGMAGRIVIGTPPASGFWNTASSDVPAPVLATLPDVSKILELSRIDRPGSS